MAIFAAPKSTPIFADNTRVFHFMGEDTMAKKTFRTGPFNQEHHERLIDLFNTLSSAAGRERPDNWERMVANLLDYAIYHFRTEADMATKSGYTETAWDKYDREMLEKRVMEMKEKVKSKELPAGSDLLLKLRDVLRTHLARERGPLMASELKL